MGTGSRRAGAPDPRPFTAAALAAEPSRAASFRRLPGLMRSAFALVRAAAPRELALGVIAQVVAATSLAAQLAAVRWLVEDLPLVIDGDAGAGRVSGALAVLVGAALAFALATVAIGHIQRLLVELVAVRAFDDIVRVAAAVELEAFEDAAYYDLLQRARTAGMYRPVEMVDAATTLTSAALSALAAGLILIGLEPLLAGLVVAAALPLLVASVVNSRRAYTFEYGLTPRNRERTYLMELLTTREAAQELRAFDASSALRERYDGLTAERLRRMRAFLRGRLRLSVLGAVAGVAGTAIALGSVVWLLDAGRLDLAAAVTALLTMQVLGAQLRNATGSVSRLIGAGTFLDDYRRFLDLSAGRLAAAHPGASTPPLTFERLDIDDVSFRYPGGARPALDGVSLDVRRGEVVALVGENGSGKTTLVKVLCGLHRPQHGQIRWNGVDAARLSREAVRSDITVLFQDYLRYQLPVVDNITLGRPGVPADPAAVAHAAARAGADGLIANLPDGYGTRLGRQFHGGHELSVGQWQRLALARAFYRGGNLLVLDEPTASLDPKAEAALFEQMRALAAGRGVLLISHRFSSVRTADRIHVLREGRIVESGTHAELIAADGHYAELFGVQAAADAGAAPPAVEQP